MAESDYEIERRSRRIPIPKVEVTIELEAADRGDLWMGSATDINGDGISLVLPREVAIGSSLVLSFSLDESSSFHRVSGTLLRYDQAAGTASILFGEWGNDDRICLLRFLAYQK